MGDTTLEKVLEEAMTLSPEEQHRLIELLAASAVQFDQGNPLSSLPSHRTRNH